MVLSDSMLNSPDTIALHTVKTIVRYLLSIYTVFNKLETNRQNYDIKHQQNIYQLES